MADEEIVAKKFTGHVSYTPEDLAASKEVWGPTVDLLKGWIEHEFEAEYEKTFDRLAGMPPAGVELFTGRDTISHLDFELEPKPERP